MIATTHSDEGPASPATTWFRQRAGKFSSLGPRESSASAAPFTSFASTIPYSPLPSPSRKQAVLRKVGSTKEKKGVVFVGRDSTSKAHKILGMSQFDIVLERERSPGATSTFRKPEKISTTRVTSRFSATTTADHHVSFQSAIGCVQRQFRPRNSATDSPSIRSHHFALLLCTLSTQFPTLPVPSISSIHPTRLHPHSSSPDSYTSHQFTKVESRDWNGSQVETRDRGE